MRVYWTPVARQRLAEIEKHIARDSPPAARRVARRLLQRSLTLAGKPLLGRKLAQYPSAEIRELLVRPFRLIFRRADDRIEILTVMHYRQLMPSDLAALGDPTDTRSH